MRIADSHEFIELYRGDKDLRLGIEMLRLRPDAEFYSLAPAAASPNDRARFGIERVLDGPLPDLPERFTLDLVPSSAIRFRRRESGGIMSFSPKFSAELRRVNPDVLFENPYTWLSPRSYQSYYASRACGFPVIYYDPGDDIDVNWRQRLLVGLEKPVIHHASRIITYNVAGRNRFVNKYGYPSERIHVIPKPVDVPACSDAAAGAEIRKTLTAGDPDAIIVAYLGRLTEYKSSRVLLDVARAALDDPSMGHCRFVFVGGALSGNEVEDEYRLPNTVVTGMIPHDQVAAYLSASDVVVFPDVTKPGGFPTAVAEAMGAGSCMIVGAGVRTDFMPLIDGETALMVEGSDRRAIAEGIRRLIREPELRRQIGTRVRRFAEENMDYPRVASQYLTIADDVISARSERGGRR